MQVQLSIEGNNDASLNGFGASTYEIRVYASGTPSNILFYEDKKALSTNEEHVNISSYQGTTVTYVAGVEYTIKVSALDSSSAAVAGETGTLVFTYYSPPADFTASISSQAAQLIVDVSGLSSVEPLITAFRLFGYNQTDTSDIFSTTVARTDTSSSFQTLIGSGDDNPNGGLWVDGETWIVNIIGQTANGNTYGTTNDITASGVIQAAPNDPDLTVTTPLLANVTNGPQFSLVIVDTIPIIENSVSAWTKSSVDIKQGNTTVTVVTDISNTGTNAGTADSSANPNTYSVSSDIGTLTLTLGPVITGSNGNTLTLDASNIVTIAVRNSNTISTKENTMTTAEASFNFINGTTGVQDVSKFTTFTPVNDNIPTLNGEPDVVQPLNVPASVIQFSYAGVTTAMPKVVDASSASQFVQPHKWTIQASIDDFTTTGTYEIDLSGNPPSEYSFDDSTGVGTLSAITLAASDFSGLSSLSADDVLALSSFLTIKLDSGSDLSGTVVETVDLSGVYRNVDDVSGSVSSITLEYPFTPNAPTLTVTNPASNPISDSSAQFIIKIEDGTPILDQSNNPVDISAVTLTITQGTNSSTLSLDVTNFDSSASYTLGPLIEGNNSFTLTTDTDVSLSCTITNSVAPTASAATTTFTLNGDASQNVFGPEFNPSFTSMVTDGSLSAALTDSDTISKNTITVNLSSGFTSATALNHLYNDNGVSDINLTISALDGNIVLDSSSVSVLDSDILLDVSLNSDPTQIILKLTASGVDAASNSWTDISLSTSALNLINSQLGITSLTASQPDKSGTTLDCSMVIDATDDNTSNYSSATATLYVNKNNDAAKPLDLSTAGLANTIAVVKVPASDVSGSDTLKKFSFDLAGQAQYLRGHALYVSVTMDSSGSANSFTTGATDTSNALVYLYTSPSITYAGATNGSSGSSTADISSNGYTVSSVFGVDNTTDGEVGLNIVYVNNEDQQTGDVSFNNQYNYAFDNNGNNNTIAYENTQINGITNTNTNLLVHMTTTIASNEDEMQIKGSAALNLTN